MPRITTASERRARTGNSFQIWGPTGVGKTSLILTLPPEDTLVIDVEGGLKSIDQWANEYPSVSATEDDPWDWPTLQDMAAWVSGPNTSYGDDEAYSKAHFAKACERFGSPEDRDRYRTFFIDSTTVVSALAKRDIWARPSSYSKTGELDARSAYGDLGDELVAWVSHLHHTQGGKNVFLVGGLEEKVDDYKRKSYAPMLDGNVAKQAIPFKMDHVFTMAVKDFPLEDGGKESRRVLVTGHDNPDKYPAKTRASAVLDPYEEPDLGAILRKIAQGVPA